MASRSSEATGNGWAETETADSPVPGAVGRGDERRVAADADPERRVAALEAELERRDRQLQLVVDHYEALLAERETADGDPAPGLFDRLRGLLGR